MSARYPIPDARPATGWILISREEDARGRRIKSDWHVCWHDVFSTKLAALDFARENNWQLGYRAVRGHLAPLPVTARGRRG